MERLLARAERKLGRFAIERLPTFIVGGMALVFFLTLSKPEFYDQLTLDPARALAQPWRFVTYFFLPNTTNLIWVLFALYWTWLVGTNLENEWGAFKLNVYYFLGALGTTLAAWITGEAQGSFWLNTSLFFAFATVFPNYPIYLFFIVRIHVKWLALVTLAFIGFYFFRGDVGVKAAIGVAFGNYLIFFGGTLLRLARGQKIQVQQAARRTSFQPPPERETEKAPERACAMCGARQEDGADIRVCSCDTCGGPRELCLEHARNH